MKDISCNSMGQIVIKYERWIRLKSLCISVFHLSSHSNTWWSDWKLVRRGAVPRALHGILKNSGHMILFLLLLFGFPATTIIILNILLLLCVLIMHFRATIFNMHNDLSIVSALQKIAPYWLCQNSTAKLKVAACSFSYFAARSWNSLPSNIRHVCKNPRHIQYPNLSPTFSLSTSQINNPNNFLRMIFLSLLLHVCVWVHVCVHARAHMHAHMSVHVCVGMCMCVVCAVCAVQLVFSIVVILRAYMYVYVYTHMSCVCFINYTAL